jgi:hypothetical protein
MENRKLTIKIIILVIKFKKSTKINVKNLKINDKNLKINNQNLRSMINIKDQQ